MRGLAAQSALYVSDCPVPASIQGSRADYTWLVDLLHCCDHLSSRSGRRLPYNPTTPTHRQRRVTTGGRRRKIAARRGGVASARTTEQQAQHAGASISPPSLSQTGRLRDFSSTQRVGPNAMYSTTVQSARAYSYSTRPERARRCAAAAVAASASDTAHSAAEQRRTALCQGHARDTKPSSPPMASPEPPRPPVQPRNDTSTRYDVMKADLESQRSSSESKDGDGIVPVKQESQTQKRRIANVNVTLIPIATDVRL